MNTNISKCKTGKASKKKMVNIVALTYLAYSWRILSVHTIPPNTHKMLQHAQKKRFLPRRMPGYTTVCDRT